jgi:hypothetical protein
MKNAICVHATKTLLIVITALIAVPAFGEIDLAGNWAGRNHQDWEDRQPGPEVLDYTSLPLNADGRARALSYTASMLSLPERQCLYYPPQYMVIGPQGIKMWAETDPGSGKIVAWKVSAAVDRAVRTIWMDGRPHPSKNALHEFSGFTTGVWEGDILTAYTTHVKAGYLRRNGVPSSDQVTFTEHFMRHEDTLTVTAIINDPVYLTEPYVLSRSWKLDPKQPMSTVAEPCTPGGELERLSANGTGTVPHFLPGENPFINEIAKQYGIPVEAVLGGAETMYPEYRKKLEPVYVRPEKCLRYCCGWENIPLVKRSLPDCPTRN